MRLTKHKIGDLVELVTETNSELKYGLEDVRGMTITKEVIPTKAKLESSDLSKFIVVKSNEFIYNPRTHGKKIGLGYNNAKNTIIISWNNIAFRVRENMKLIVLSDYLFLHFNRSEWDREACFQSWGSSTEVFSWSTFCDMCLDLPSIGIQQKYVDIYNAMVENQKSYETGLEDLKLVCDGYIEELYINTPKEKIGPYIKQKNEKNEDLKFDVASVKGISNNKTFIETKANMKSVSLKQYLIVDVMDFAYVPVTSRNGEKISLALNNGEGAYICSSSYTVYSTNKSKLLPEYLAMWFSRKEFDRYARFHSWGSARETFTWEDMSEVEIPIPDLSIQQNIVNIYKVYQERKEINEKLKQQIKDICPILIKGSIEEARK